MSILLKIEFVASIRRQGIFKKLIEGMTIMWMQTIYRRIGEAYTFFPSANKLNVHRSRPSAIGVPLHAVGAVVLRCQPHTATELTELTGYLHRTLAMISCDNLPSPAFSDRFISCRDLWVPNNTTLTSDIFLYSIKTDSHSIWDQCGGIIHTCGALLSLSKKNSVDMTEANRSGETHLYKILRCSPRNAEMTVVKSQIALDYVIVQRRSR
jgi:hypothetical protein